MAPVRAPMCVQHHNACPSVSCIGKVDCLIVDFTDRSHRLDKASDLVTSEYMFTPGEGEFICGGGTGRRVGDKVVLDLRSVCMCVPTNL